jgi:hypothetical protein
MTRHDSTTGAPLSGVRASHDIIELPQQPPSIKDQVEQVEALLLAVRETVTSLAEASEVLERRVEQALDGHVPPRRPSSAHPAQAAVDRAALLEAVENRAVIEQAKGMLMLKHRCDADSAFGLLVEISRRERRKVRDIAGDIVRSGTRPRRVVDVTDGALRSTRLPDEAHAQ